MRVIEPLLDEAITKRTQEDNESNDNLNQEQDTE
jgi:hypothetical protein